MLEKAERKKKEKKLLESLNSDALRLRASHFSISQNENQVQSFLYSDEEDQIWTSLSEEEEEEESRSWEYAVEVADAPPPSRLSTESFYSFRRTTFSTMDSTRPLSLPTVFHFSDLV
jgi:hypothetical protein